MPCCTCAGVLVDLRERLHGRRVVLSYSGGKDSNACGLELKRLGIPFEAVFCDTGWEARQTYEYIKQAAEWLGPITTVRAEVDLPPDLAALAELYETRLGMEYSSMVRWILRKGMLPSRGRKWCTEELKVKPFADHLRGMDDDVVVVVGIRAEESYQRSMLGVWEYQPTYDADMWRPLLAWSEEQVIEAHRLAQIAPNPLYLMDDIQRVGCWPCINTRKSELRAIALEDPGRIGILEDLERWTTARIAERALARGEKMKIDVVGWFHGRADSERGKPFDPIPISRAVAWAMGGTVQLGMFAPVPSRAGCMRWGMCEVVPSRLEEGA